MRESLYSTRTPERPSPAGSAGILAGGLAFCEAANFVLHFVARQFRAGSWKHNQNTQKHNKTQTNTITRNTNQTLVNKGQNTINASKKRKNVIFFIFTPRILETAATVGKRLF